MQRLIARVWKFALWDHGFGIFVLIFVPLVVVVLVGTASGWLPPYALVVPFIIPVGVWVVGGVIMVVMLYRGCKEDVRNIKTKPNANHI